MQIRRPRSKCGVLGKEVRKERGGEIPLGMRFATSFAGERVPRGESGRTGKVITN